MRKLFVFLLVVFIVFGLCSCQTADNQEITGVWYSSIDGQLVCSLDGNPTTGYVWSYEVDNDSVITYVDDVYKMNEHPQGFVGVGGHWEFVFKAFDDGTAKINFFYSRPWESEAIEKRTLTVCCKKGKITSIAE